jgi:hypothetical protein
MQLETVQCRQSRFSLFFFFFSVLFFFWRCRKVLTKSRCSCESRRVAERTDERAQQLPSSTHRHATRMSILRRTRRRNSLPRIWVRASARSQPSREHPQLEDRHPLEWCSGRVKNSRAVIGSRTSRDHLPIVLLVRVARSPARCVSGLSVACAEFRVNFLRMQRFRVPGLVLFFFNNLRGIRGRASFGQSRREAGGGDSSVTSGEIFLPRSAMFYLYS